MTTTIGKVFDSGLPNNIVARIDEAIDVIDDLTQPVGNQSFDVKSLSLDAGLPTLSLFDTPVKLGATLKLQAGIAAAGDTFQPFEEATAVKAPDGTSYASLALDAKLSASGQGGGKSGVLAVSAEASATAQFSYLHLLPVPQTASRLTALIDLVRTTELPQFAAFDKLRDGEVLHFDAMLNLDFGIKAQYGAALDINETVAVVADLPLPVKAHAEFSANASLGFGLYEDMTVTVAKADQRNDGWVRIRFSRTHRSRITFGAAFSLAVQYDASSGVTMLLDKTFAQLQMPKLVDDIREVAVLAQKPWSEIKTELSAKAGAAVVALVGDTGWKQWLDDDPRVQQLLGVSNWIVDRYDKLDEKVKSIWEELLARLDDTGFAKVRERIHQLATLNPSTISLDDLTDGKLNPIIDLVELLSGQDIEELVVSGKIKDGLDRAVAAAKRVDDAIDTAPDKAIDFLRGFAERTGIASVVDWLRKNATTVEGLKSAGDSWIRGVVERLVGKVLDQVDVSDVARLQGFAAKVQKLIDAPQALEAKLKKAVAKLKGDFTMSLSIEISRVSETSALVDLEIDATKPQTANALSRFLPSGNVQQLLETLNSADETTFDIRELILTSRKIRTSTGSLFFSFLGSKITVQQSRIQEGTVRFSGGGNVPKKRSGLYSGGNIIRRSDSSAIMEGAAFVRIEATAANLLPDAKYDKADSSLRLTYVREDANTRDEELSSMIAILGDLGMLGDANIDSSTVAAQTRFAVELNLPSSAVIALTQDIADENGWNLDMRNAGARWFRDKGLHPGDVKAGQEIASAIANSNFPAAWTDQQRFADAARTGQLEPVRWDSMHGRLQIQYLPLQTFTNARALRYSRYRDFQPLAKDAQPAPAQVQKVTALAAALFSIGADEWPVPLLNFWLVLSRLSRIAPATLKEAHGVATLRSRPNDKAAWSDPQWFTLPEGVGIWPVIRNRCFPIT